MRPDERLDASGVCHELAVLVYRATSAWPRGDSYGLAAQARRAAFAAALFAAADPPTHAPDRRRGRPDRGLGALGRLRYALLLARELGYLAVDEWESLDRLRHRAEELTRALLPTASAPPRLPP